MDVVRQILRELKQRSTTRVRQLHRAVTAMIVMAAVVAPLAAQGHPVTAAGRTAGQFDVSQTGAATYTIPLWTPPGVRGIQPHLALTYNSRVERGSLGPGWSLSGLSQISRCNATYAQDSQAAPVTLTYADKFCLDGVRLRMTSGSSYGASDTFYQSEIANFSRVISYGTAGNGPARFYVSGKDGLTYEYGDSNDGVTTPSRVIAPGTTTAYQWLLSRVYDRQGNTMEIQYEADGGSAIPTAVEYTGAGLDRNFPYKVVINYVVRDAVDSTQASIGGTSVSRSKQISSIDVMKGSATLRHYELGYAVSPTTQRYRLSEVQECGGAAGVNCLRPTTFTYSDGAAGVAAATDLGAMPFDITRVRVADITGDGREDIVYAITAAVDDYRTYVMPANSTGFGEAKFAGSARYIDPTLMDDFDGDGNVDILQGIGGIWVQYRWDGNSMSGSSTGVAMDSARTPSNAGTASADLNGDGLPDLVWMRTDGSIYCQLNTSTPGTISFAPSASLLIDTRAALAAYPGYSTFVANSSKVHGNNDQKWMTSKVRHLDFNGDGREDLMLELWNQSASLWQGATLVSVPGGGYTIPNPTTVLASSLPVEWNDDACTDLASILFVRIGTCDGSNNAELEILGFFPNVAMDWDGDGRVDLVGSGNGATVLRSTGSGAIPINTGDPNIGGLVLDQNGDGLDDLISGRFSDEPLYLRLHNGANVQPDLLASVTDGYGVFANVSYQSTAQGSYSTTAGGVTCASPCAEKNYTAPIQVVSHVTASDGAGASYALTFSYGDARTNIRGRGFAGFRTQSVIDSRQRVTTRTFQTEFPYTGMVDQEILYQGTATTKSPIHRRTATPAVKALDNSVANQRYFPYAGTIEDKQYEVGGTRYGLESITTLQTPTYDDYGNAVNLTSTVTDNDPASTYAGGQWTTTVAQTITPSTGIYWCLGLSTQTLVTKTAPGPTGTSSITRTTTRTPDYPSCRIADETIEPLSSKYAVTRGFEFDNFGNVNKLTVTGAGMPSRVTEIGWGATGQFPVSITNPLLQTTITPYDDRFGLPQTQTDPNGISTSYIYDAFGRLQQETRADGTYTEWVYNDCSTFGGCLAGNAHSLAVAFYVHNRTGGGIFTRGSTRYDQFDRPTVAAQFALDGGFNRVDIRYDNLGRVQRRSMPCAWVDVPTECGYWATYEYDVLNRITKESRPISASVSTPQETSMMYEGRKTTVTDALLHRATRWNTVAGTLYRSEDHNGYAQIFGYDAFNSLVSVTDSLLNTLFSASYDYGIDAFQVGSNDMDLGSRGYTINALGEMRAMTDNNGSSFVTDYDPLSRPVTRTVAGQTTTWTWGNGHNRGLSNEHNIGQLAAITSTGGTTENYYYDDYGRPTKREIVADGATYAYDYTYDGETGALDTLTYPTSTSYRLALKYTYLNGTLNAVKDNATNAIFWQADAVNPRGQVTNETLGNGLKTTRIFDAVTGWVSAIQCGPNGGTCSQNQGYLYDLVGNVKQRQNNNLGLTEDFWYDEINRLDYSKLNNQLNLDMSYDPMGNITSKSDVAGGTTWTYDPTHKHQLRVAGTSGVAYTYDANGNAITRGSQTIGWDPYNYPTLFSAAGENIALYYNANHERWKQVLTTSAVQVTTIYAGKLFEKVTIGSADEYRHYIYANGSAVAVMSRASGGGATTRYLLRDHLGSVAKVADGTGAAVVSESFTPFGERRNPATWSGVPVNGELAASVNVTQQGYTGQDGLGSLGLNHMNGRVQDAVTGRFLSADPYITEQMNTQSYNRYSYVYNNPLTFIDPSGFECAWVGQDCIDGVTVTGSSSDWNFADPPTSPGDGDRDRGGGSGDGGSPVPNPIIERVLVTIQRERKKDSCEQASDLSAQLAGGGAKQPDGNNMLGTADSVLTLGGGMVDSAAESTRGNAFIRMTSDANDKSALAIRGAITNAEVFGPMSRPIFVTGLTVNFLQIREGYRQDGWPGAAVASLDSGVTLTASTYGGLWGMGFALAYNAQGGAMGVWDKAKFSGQLDRLNSLAMLCALGR